ncbi:hypothetical protein GCM10023080_094140 [Streptomyces pseudoechinosporeus]
MQTRTVALIAASVATAAVTVTGVTYASAAGSSPESASSVREAVRPASAPLGGSSEIKDNYGHKKDGGEIQINERTYSADPGACVAVVSPIAVPGGVPGSYNVSNTTARTVQFFNGPNCNAGAPVAVVGHNATAFGVLDGVVGSFRVVD